MVDDISASDSVHRAIGREQRAVLFEAVVAVAFLLNSSRCIVPVQAPFVLCAAICQRRALLVINEKRVVITPNVALFFMPVCVAHVMTRSTTKKPDVEALGIARCTCRRR